MPQPEPGAAAQGAVVPGGAAEAAEIADGVLFVILFYAGVALGAGTPLALAYRLMARGAARR